METHKRNIDSITTMKKKKNYRKFEISPEVLARQKRTHIFNVGILQNWYKVVDVDQ